MWKSTIKERLAILLAVLFVVSLTAAAVNAEANAAASCSITSKIAKTSGCTYTIKCSSAGSEGDEYLWTFGDCKSSTSENPSHIYTNCKLHKVQLTVTDNTDDSEDTFKLNI